jgi:hypothetical protein
MSSFFVVEMRLKRMQDILIPSAFFETLEAGCAYKRKTIRV